MFRFVTISLERIEKQSKHFQHPLTIYWWIFSTAATSKQIRWWSKAALTPKVPLEKLEGSKALSFLAYLLFFLLSPALLDASAVSGNKDQWLMSAQSPFLLLPRIYSSISHRAVRKLPYSTFVCIMQGYENTRGCR